MSKKILGFYQTGSIIGGDAVYHLGICDANGNLLDTWTIEAINNRQGICGDTKGNIYTIANSRANIIKRDKSGTIVKTKTGLSYATAIAFGPDGYIYCKDFIGSDDAILKIDVDTLETVNSITLPSKQYYGMAIDSDGYIYMVNYDDHLIEKWNFSTETKIADHSISVHQATNTVLGTAGNLVAGTDLYTPYHIWTIPKDLSEDPTDWDVDSIAKPGGVSSINGDFLFIGHDASPELPEFPFSKIKVSRYTTSKVKVWEAELISSGGTGFGCITTTELEAYDYPIAPVLFPAKKRGTTLKMDCINFEESMSDVCLVVNHNSRVTREYLQTTYVETTYNESSNLRFVLSSQQLVKLSSKDLTEEDFKGIISNFISNISDMFILINQNNTLVKQWLDDYAPNEEGHDFTDVKMRPIIVGKDLTKTMDELFEGMEDNVTILNSNLELLKERF